MARFRQNIFWLTAILTSYCASVEYGLSNRDEEYAELAIIPLVRKMTHLPVIFDPSHATGKRDLVLPTALAAIVVGAHGVIVEIHPDPEHALSDGAQSLHFKEFNSLLDQMKSLISFKKQKLTVL